MKVLVISHNPLCSYNAMGKTLSSLFSRFSREELCQLYIYPSCPDAELCASYYRITDKDVLRALPRLAQPGGELDRSLISPEQAPFEEERDEALYRNARNKAPIRRLARDAIWKLSRWNGGRLRAWLDREAPDRIFVAPGPARFLYGLALDISEERGIPIAAYICDEYYFVRPAKDAVGRLQQRLLRRKIELLMERSGLLVTISEELKEAYAGRFSLPTQVLMTGSTLKRAPAAFQPKAGGVSYFGNVRSNRYRSLAEIGRCLAGINRRLGSDYRLHIYTAEHDPQILSALEKEPCIELHGFLRGEAFEEELQRAGLLAHVEAFDEESVDRVKHSVSTKIADGLACGVPMLAYGPAGLASIEHLRRGGCAFVCTEPEELEQTLLSALTDAEARRACVRRALETAAALHDADRNSLALRSMLEQLRSKR